MFSRKVICVMNVIVVKRDVCVEFTRQPTVLNESSGVTRWLNVLYTWPLGNAHVKPRRCYKSNEPNEPNELI